MKILLAVDGSPFSRKMLIYVASNEKWFRREFTYILLHVAPGGLQDVAAHQETAGASRSSTKQPIFCAIRSASTPSRCRSRASRPR